MKNFLLYLAIPLLLISCSSQGTVSDDHRTIRERVVAVDTKGSTTILSAGKYDKWYRVETPLVEGMSYVVTLEIPRQREKNQVINAVLTDFSPDGYVQRDVFARFEMAYNQVRSGSKDQ